MARPSIYKILENPKVYSFVLSFLQPGMDKGFQKNIPQHLNLKAECTLDVGCGPKPVINEPNGKLVGIDVNEEYIKEFTYGHLDSDPSMDFIENTRTRFGFVGSADSLPFPDNTFNESRTVGVFHHLTDAQVDQAAAEMKRCTKSGGTVVILDNVWPKNALTRPIAWLLRYLDRGEYVRTESELSKRLEKVLGSYKTKHRFTYSYNGLEAIIFVFEV
ncbi:MAG: methyltransferase domain-containing protein [Bdellovibrionales bacterium]